MDEVPVAAAPKSAPRKREAKSKNWCFTVWDVHPDWTRDKVNLYIDVATVTYLILGREIAPTTDNFHLQGYVQFIHEERFSAIQKNFPAFQNLQKIKGTPWQNFIYCSADKNFEEWGTRPKKPKEKGSGDMPYADALAAPTIREGIAIIKEKKPRDYCLHGESIERNLKRAKIEPFLHKFSPDSFTTPLQPLNKSTLIYGETDLGKTHYAAAHFKNPLVCSHIDTLKSLCKDHDGVIFDDMSFKHWPVESVIHLVDTEFSRTINVRYGTVTIPANTRKIFTHNTSNPFYGDTTDPTQSTAIDRRISLVHVFNKVF